MLPEAYDRASRRQTALLIRFTHHLSASDARVTRRCSTQEAEAPAEPQRAPWGVMAALRERNALRSFVESRPRYQFVKEIGAGE